MLTWKLKGITLGQNVSLLKGNTISKEIQLHFQKWCFEIIFLFTQTDFRVFWFCKMAHCVSFEPIETYLHKNVYPSDIIGDKGKKS